MSDGEDDEAPRALGRIPSGLFVVTVCRGDVETGMLASWVQQCSFEPPQLDRLSVRRDRTVNDWLPPETSLYRQYSRPRRARIWSASPAYAVSRWASWRLKAYRRWAQPQTHRRCCAALRLTSHAVSCKRVPGRRSRPDRRTGGRRTAASRRASVGACAQEWPAVLSEVDGSNVQEGRYVVIPSGTGRLGNAARGCGGSSRAADLALYGGLRAGRMIGCPSAADARVAATGVPGKPNLFYVGVNNGGVGNAPTPDAPGRPSSTTSRPAPSVPSPSPRPIPTSSTPAAARACNGPTCPPATAHRSARRRQDVEERRTTRWSADFRPAQRLPKDPDRVFVAVLSHPYGPNKEPRRVYRTNDGGKTREHVLFKNENTGAVGLAFDPVDARTVFRGAVGRSKSSPGRTARGRGRAAACSSPSTAARPAALSPKDCPPPSRSWVASASTSPRVIEAAVTPWSMRQVRSSLSSRTPARPDDASTRSRVCEDGI